MNPLLKNLGIWLLIGLVLFVLFNVINTKPYGAARLSFSEFLTQVEADKVTEVTLRGGEAVGLLSDQTQFQTNLPEYPELIPILVAHNVRVRSEAPNKGGLLLAILNSWFPMLLIIGIWIFFMRQVQGGGNRALSFGKIRARQLDEKNNPITFKDVAGIEESKDELREIVDFLRDPKKFERLGGQIPRGVLLMGPPGTGKTLLAKAIAGEAGVPFFSISGSDFVEMFVGVGASRVRDLFEQAKKNAPCIIFMDEIDAVGRHRGTGLGGGHDEREQTLNQLLVEMDGFEANEGIIVVAATNRPDVLDPALLRPGRFDRRVVLDRPDIRGREAILKIHAKGKPLAPSVNLENLAKQTVGFSGADLSNLVNEAAILAARNNRKVIENEDFEESIDRVIAGPERKSRRVSAKEKEITAYHEAGHAFVAHKLPNADPVHKISIVARGMTLGHTLQLPAEDRYLMTRAQFRDELATLLGGFVAEELVFNELSTGASNDIKRATDLASKMVTSYGMSQALGPRTFGNKEELVFLGREISEQRDYGDKVADQIDEEVKAIIQTAYDTARKILSENKARLKYIAEKLVATETLEGEELEKIFDAMLPVLPPEIEITPKVLPAPAPEPETGKVLRPLPGAAAAGA